MIVISTTITITTKDELEPKVVIWLTRKKKKNYHLMLNDFPTPANDPYSDHCLW